jgi:mono/diheme cytochrome c family protein
MKMKKIFLILICLIFSSSAFADSKMELGLEVFNNKAQCGMCHTLQAAGSEGQIGTNLDQLKPLMPQVVSAVTNGISVMPSFEGMLSSEEIEAVSYFVSTSTNQ